MRANFTFDALTPPSQLSQSPSPSSSSLSVQDIFIKKSSFRSRVGGKPAITALKQMTLVSSYAPAYVVTTTPTVVAASLSTIPSPCNSPSTRLVPSKPTILPLSTTAAQQQQLLLRSSDEYNPFYRQRRKVLKHRHRQQLRDDSSLISSRQSTPHNHKNPAAAVGSDCLNSEGFQAIQLPQAQNRSISTYDSIIAMDKIKQDSPRVQRSRAHSMECSGGGGGSLSSRQAAHPVYPLASNHSGSSTYSSIFCPNFSFLDISHKGKRFYVKSHASVAAGSPAAATAITTKVSKLLDKQTLPLDLLRFTRTNKNQLPFSADLPDEQAQLVKMKLVSLRPRTVGLVISNGFSKSALKKQQPVASTTCPPASSFQMVSVVRGQTYAAATATVTPKIKKVFHIVSSRSTSSSNSPSTTSSTAFLSPEQSQLLSHENHSSYKVKHQQQQQHHQQSQHHQQQQPQESLSRRQSALLENSRGFPYQIQFGHPFVQHDLQQQQQHTSNSAVTGCNITISNPSYEPLGFWVVDNDYPSLPIGDYERDTPPPD